MEEGMLIKHNSYFYQQKARGYEQSINKNQQNSSWQTHDSNNRKKTLSQENAVCELPEG